MVTMENQKGANNTQDAALRLLWGFSHWTSFLITALVWAVDYKAVSGWPRVKPSWGPPCPRAMLRVKLQCGVSYSTPSLETKHGWMPCWPPPSSSCRSSLITEPLPSHSHQLRQIVVLRGDSPSSSTSTDTLYFILASPGPHAKSRNVLPDNTVASSPRHALSDLSLLPNPLSVVPSFFNFYWHLFFVEFISRS